MSTTPLDYLKTHRVGVAFIPLKGREDRLRLNCVARVLSKSSIAEIQFLPGQVMADQIDIRGRWLLTFETGENIFSFFATLEEKKAEHKFLLQIHEEMDHSQKREYFRIATTDDTNVAVSVVNNNETASCVGETIDISGSGIQVSFPQPFAISRGAKLKIVIDIPGPEPSQVCCTTRVIRLDTSLAYSFKLALHFENISMKDHDAIIAYCLMEQRKQLRLKVRVMGPSA